MFEKGCWVYYLGLLLCGLAAVYLNANQAEYSLLDATNNLRKRRASAVYAITALLVGYLVFWAAIRNGITDTYEYIAEYERLNPNLSVKYLFTSDTVKAPLFDLFQVIVKRLGFNYHVFIGGIAVITGICIYYTFSRFSDDVAFSTYLLITSFFYYSWMLNGIRQFLVVAIFFACFRLIAEKKFWKLLIVVAICYFIHTTAIIMIPIYFIANMKNWSYGIYACVLATMAVAVLFPSQFTALLDNSFEEYNVAEQFAEDDGVNILRFFVAMIPPVIAFVFREDIKALNNPYINVMVNLSLITAGLYAVGVATSGIYMGRLPVYTEIFNFLFLPFLIRNVLPKNLRGPIWVAALGLYFLYFYLQAGDRMYYTTDLFPGLDNSVV